MVVSPDKIAKVQEHSGVLDIVYTCSKIRAALRKKV
jgi:hypothetical protein